jgi:hypothetical protein
MKQLQHILPSFEEARAAVLSMVVVVASSPICIWRWRLRRWRVVRTLVIVEVALVPWWGLVRWWVRPLRWRIHTMGRVNMRSMALRWRVHIGWRWVRVRLRWMIP